MGGISSGLSSVINSSSTLTNVTNKVKTTISNKVSEVKSSISNKVNQVKEYIICTNKKPDIGNKMEYIFGNATGSSHNISRSLSMERELNSIGIFDNENGREIVTDVLYDAFGNLNNGVIQENGRIAVNSLLSGSNGFAELKTVWDSNKLITVQVFKSSWRSIR